MNIPLITLAIITMTASIAIFMTMIRYLQTSGEKINWFLIRLYMPKYVHRYRMLKIQNGESTALFTWWLILINSALIFVILSFAL